MSAALVDETDRERICRIARSDGLTPNNIMRLVKDIESKKIDEKVKLRLIECLIPQETIPEEAFIKMTCLLSNLKFSSKLKIEILKWMITVYPFMKTSSGNFRFLYEVFLSLLEQKNLRHYVCHLIFLITQKNMVTSERVLSLLKMIEKYKQPCLLLVLHCYQTVSPEYFNGEVNLDVEYDFESLGIYPSLIKHVHPSYELHISYITTLEASSIEILSESTPSEKSSNSVSFRVGPFHEMYQEFKALEMSTNMSKILKSRLRRLFLTSDLPRKVKIKLMDYTWTLLFQNLDSLDFLEDSLGLFHDMQFSFLAISDFTEALVSSYTSNFELSADIITEILQYEPMNCFERIGYKFDLIREQILKTNIVSVKCQLLNCLSKIYQNWVLLEYDDSSNTSVSCDEQCSSVENRSSATIHDPSSEIYELSSYIDQICDALIVDDFHPCLLNEILIHYEKVSRVHTNPGKNLVINFPTRPVFHLALFSLSAHTLDTLSRLMLRYNTELELMEEKKNPKTKTATRCYTFCSNDVRKIFLECSYVDFSDTYLSKYVVKKLKEKCPHFENSFMLHRHPALLLKIISFDDVSQLQYFSVDPNIRCSFFQHISEDGRLRNLVKLLTILKTATS